MYLKGFTDFGAAAQSKAPSLIGILAAQSNQCWFLKGWHHKLIIILQEQNKDKCERLRKKRQVRLKQSDINKKENEWEKI